MNNPYQSDIKKHGLQFPTDTSEAKHSITQVVLEKYGVFSGHWCRFVDHVVSAKQTH